MEAFFAEQRKDNLVEKLINNRKWEGYEKALQAYFSSIIEEKVPKNTSNERQ